MEKHDALNNEMAEDSINTIPKDQKLMEVDVKSDINDQKNQNYDKDLQDSSFTSETEKIDIVNSVWIQQPFSDIEDCIDTLALYSDNQGYHYSCEHQTSDSISYEVNKGLITINIWRYKSEVNASQGKEVQSKYFMKVNDKSLVMTDIKHLRYGGKFESVNPKFINQIYYRLK